MVNGEIEYRRGRTTTTAFAHLREAVRLEDNLPYDEPWGWMQPARHALGALLLERRESRRRRRWCTGPTSASTRASSARAGIPENVWALHGLHEALLRQGKRHDAAMIAPRLELALARADIAIDATAGWRPGTGRRRESRRSAGMRLQVLAFG